MTICETMFAAVDKRLKEKKSLEEIGNDLCAGVKNPRGKAIRIVKAYKGKKYLKENAKWLGYKPDSIRSKGRPEENRLKKFNQKEDEYDDGILDMIQNAEQINGIRMGNTNNPGSRKHLKLGVYLLGRPKGITGLRRKGWIYELHISPSTTHGRHFVDYLEMNMNEDVCSTDFGGWEGFAQLCSWPDTTLDLIVNHVGNRWLLPGCKWDWDVRVIEKRFSKSPYSHISGSRVDDFYHS